MHKLLERQIRKFCGSMDAVPSEMHDFVAAVGLAYLQFDNDGALLEHSMETVSGELTERFRLLREALTESQRAKEEQSQAVSMLAATLDSTTDGVLVVDRTGKMVRMNRRFIELWRIPEDIQTSRDDAAALAYVLGQLRDPAQFLEKVNDLYSHPEDESFETLRFKDGRTFERYSLPQRIADDIVGRVWSFRDITARLKLEDQLRHAQKMEAVGALAGGIAHDFNNLLMVIGGHAAMLADSSALPEEGRADLAVIAAATDRAAALTGQLLAFSRKQAITPVTLDLNEVVATFSPILHRLIGEHIEVSTHLTTEAMTVLADRGQLEQVLMNLVVNARDAIPGGGRIEIVTDLVEITNGAASENAGVSPGAYVRLAVADTGIGVSPAISNRIFEPFFTTKSVGKGTGLGLSTVFGIVQQSGGHISVASEVGTGTTFTILLPWLLHSLATSAEGSLTPTKPAGGETVLVAEDVEEVLRVVQRRLEGAGYVVLTAHDGDEALLVAERHAGPIDLVITDVVMPGMSGPALAARLRERRPSIRVLYMSGYAEGYLPNTGPGTTELILEKPFSNAQLADAVRAALA